MKQTNTNTNTKPSPKHLELGQTLREARLKRGWSVADAARELKLKPEDIHRFENGTHHLLTVYEKGSLQAYARLLDVPVEEEDVESAGAEERDAPLGRKFQPLRSFVASTAIAKTWIVGIILFSFVAVGFLVFRLLAPPTLIVHSPTQDQFVQASSIEISGRTSTGSEVFINGSPVLVDLEGNFSDTFLLREGVNDVTITATNSLGHTAQIERIIVAEYPGAETKNRKPERSGE